MFGKTGKEFQPLSKRTSKITQCTSWLPTHCFPQIKLKVLRHLCNLMLKSASVPHRTNFCDSFHFSWKCSTSDSRNKELSFYHYFHVITAWIWITNECFWQEPDVDLESTGDMLFLSPVSRKDSGIYQCRPLDNDGYTEVKGEMQLTVHCEE